MTEQTNDISNSIVKKRLSEQEKRDYYKAWQKSGMDKTQFCKLHGLAVNELYYWHKQFKEKPTEPKQFAPVIAKRSQSNYQPNMTQLEIRLPNQTQLLVSLRENQLISFIQELCNAVTIIR